MNCSMLLAYQPLAGGAPIDLDVLDSLVVSEQTSEIGLRFLMADPSIPWGRAK